MKKVLMIGLLLCASTVIFAQGPGGGMRDPAEMAKRQTDWMKSELKLSDEQTVAVDAINVSYSKKMQEMFAGGPGGDFDEMREKMTKLNADKEAELAKVLTAEQLETYKKKAAEMSRGPGGPGGPGGPPGGR
ncbi:MAG: DUF4890 domain-containing protein [Tannerella sp.]|nr:DUF4890 domain-containing protein [Tannerella sp.]